MGQGHPFALLERVIQIGQQQGKEAGDHQQGEGHQRQHDMAEQLGSVLQVNDVMGRHQTVEPLQQQGKTVGHRQQDPAVEPMGDKRHDHTDQQRDCRGDIEQAHILTGAHMSHGLGDGDSVQQHGRAGRGIEPGRLLLIEQQAAQYHRDGHNIEQQGCQGQNDHSLSAVGKAN